MILKLKNIILLKCRLILPINEIGGNHRRSFKVTKRTVRPDADKYANIIKQKKPIVNDEILSKANLFKVSYINQSTFQMIKKYVLFEEEVSYVKNIVKVNRGVFSV